MSQQTYMVLSIATIQLNSSPLFTYNKMIQQFYFKQLNLA